MKSDKFKGILDGLGKIKINVPKIEPIIPNNMLDPTRKEYHSPEEILEEDEDEFERPDFSEWKCKICGKFIEEGYFWYYLRYERNVSKSIATCSKECLDKLVKNYNCSEYEIYEYSRCSAYFKCEEIGNLRNMCETVENKTYQSIFSISTYNHCEPAQAGVILSTHKLTDTLVDFSKQTEEQFLYNKEMMEKSARESSKQFRITTWMTILVIILTIANLIPVFINWGSNDYSEQYMEKSIDRLYTAEGLNGINEKLDKIIRLINSVEDGNVDTKTNEIIKLIESIQEQLNGDGL